MVFLDNGDTAIGRVQCFLSALLRAFPSRGASLSVQNLTITIDSKVSEGRRARL